MLATHNLLEVMSFIESVCANMHMLMMRYRLHIPVFLCGMNIGHLRLEEKRTRKKRNFTRLKENFPLLQVARKALRLVKKKTMRFFTKCFFNFFTAWETFMKHRELPMIQPINYIIYTAKGGEHLIYLNNRLWDHGK